LDISRAGRSPAPPDGAYLPGFTGVEPMVVMNHAGANIHFESPVRAQE